MRIRPGSIPEPVKHVIHAGSRTYGRMTAQHRVLPKLLISGGQRCGTTSMYRALAQHPGFMKPVLHKGIHFFDTDYHRGLSWYQAHFPTKATAERIHTEWNLNPIAYESSPYYLYHPLAATRFARDLNKVKIVVLVRDPVERARSQHAHEIARGFETITDFEGALAAEPKRLAGQTQRLQQDPTYYSFSHQHHAYRDRGHYVEHLDRLAKSIRKDRIHVIDSGLFFTQPEATFAKLLRFLDMPEHEGITFAQHNARQRPAPRDTGIDRELRDYYAPHDARLTRWLGAPPSWRI